MRRHQVSGPPPLVVHALAMPTRCLQCVEGGPTRGTARCPSQPIAGRWTTYVGRVAQSPVGRARLAKPVIDHTAPLELSVRRVSESGGLPLLSPVRADCVSGEDAS